MMGKNRPKKHPVDPAKEREQQLARRQRRDKHKPKRHKSNP